MKYHKSKLSFVLFNGDLGTISQDFITEKSVLSAEKKIENLEIQEIEQAVIEEFDIPEP